MRYIHKNDLLIIAKNSGYLMIGIGLMCLIPIIIDLITGLRQFFNQILLHFEATMVTRYGDDLFHFFCC